MTGASGFVGRRLVARADPTTYHRICCLTRREAPLSHDSAHPHPVEYVRGDVTDSASYAGSLSGIDIVTHLAAVTGKAKRCDYFRVNTGGTKLLLEQCRLAGVRRFVYVSSIAAGFQHTSAYHYAHSKLEAEEAVRASGLNYVIVRPTLVFGRGSAVWQNLLRLTSGFATPMFGNGRVTVQPIYIDDLVDCMLAIMAEPELPNQIFEIGGPDVLTFEELIRRIHQAYRMKDAHLIHLPVWTLIAVLSRLERVGFTALPVTAGHLAAFVNDSAAQPDPTLARYVARMTTLDEMLHLLDPNA